MRGTGSAVVDADRATTRRTTRHTGGGFNLVEDRRIHDTPCAAAIMAACDAKGEDTFGMRSPTWQ
jgi:hypothetical protein